jgi:hypothetical protein
MLPIARFEESDCTVVQEHVRSARHDRLFHTSRQFNVGEYGLETYWAAILSYETNRPGIPIVRISKKNATAIRCYRQTAVSIRRDIDDSLTTQTVQTAQWRHLNT